MSPRQARRERREAERKARKAEIKRMKAARHIPAEAPKQSRDRQEAVLGSAPLPDFSEANLRSFLMPLPTPAKPLEQNPNREGGESRSAEPPPTPAGFVSQSAQSRRETNRANAQHSTGPRSITGKLASSRNSLQHGLASCTLIIPGENPADFEQLTVALLEEHQPTGETETLLVHEMARSWWLTQRAIRLQNECFTEDGGIDEKRLSLLLRYQTTHERAFHKALDTLMKLKRSRDRKGAVPGVGFVSQNGTPTAREGTNIGFVSQNPAAGAPNSLPSLAEAA